MNYKQIVIVTMLALLMAYFYDYFTAFIVWSAYLILVIAKSIREDYRRKDKMVIDRKAMFKEAANEVTERVAQGKATTRAEAMTQMKQDGFWKRLTDKLRSQPPETKTVEKKEELKKIIPQYPPKETSTPKKLVWTFDEDDDELPNLASNDITVEVTKERGNEYSAMVKTILASGTTNWNERVTQLDALKNNIETTVKQLKTSYDEIRHERVLVDNLAKLKQKRIE